MLGVVLPALFTLGAEWVSISCNTVDIDETVVVADVVSVWFELIVATTGGGPTGAESVENSIECGSKAITAESVD